VLKRGQREWVSRPNNRLVLGNGPFLTTTFSFLSSRAKPRDLQFLSGRPHCAGKNDGCPRSRF